MSGREVPPIGPLVKRMRLAWDAAEACGDAREIEALSTEFTAAMCAVIEWSRAHNPCVKCNRLPAHPLSRDTLCDPCLVGAGHA